MRTLAGVLRELLRELTVSVVVDGHPTGTAFFVDEGLLLTCEHVVDGRDECEVVPLGREPRRAVVVERVGDAVDAALLAVEPHPDEPPQACVALDDVLRSGPHLLAGFPRELGAETGLEIIDTPAHPRDAVDGAPLALQIAPDTVVTGGMSGGPVVDLQTGAVVGIVRVAHHHGGSFGGGAVPIEIGRAHV